jgi:hypothetical protein
LWDNPATEEDECDGLDLREQIEAPIAIDEDGTLIVCSRGYVLALRPLLGDFNGDGCRNNFDVDALELALEDYGDWGSTYGAPIGINLLGVGDANNDGVFDEYDIDGFVDIILADPGCGPGWGGTQCIYNEFFAAPESACPEEPGPEDWEHFWEVINRLYMKRYGR